jgi:xylulokinase
MKKSYLIGIDAGVSFVKAGVYDIEGNCEGVVNKSSPGDYPSPGVFIQKNEEYLTTVLDALKEAVEISGIDSSDVEAVGFSSAMGGATGVDKDWNVILDWSIISDTRYYPFVVEMQEAAADLILRLSGTNFPLFAPKLLWWKKDFPEAYKKVRKFMFLCGYLVGKLCDIPSENAYVDRTFMQISSLADIGNEKWSDEICKIIGIDKNLLPKIVGSQTVVGRLSGKFAEKCGLKAGTPFVAGMGDKPAGCLGAGLVSPGVLIDESASFAALSLCVDKYVPDVENKTLENMPSPVKGFYFPCFFLFGSGVTHAWFKDNFGAEEIEAASNTGKSPFEFLDEKAAKLPPGSEGLLSVSLLGGRGYPSDPDIKGMWIGHTWSHKKEHFYRSMLESFAYEYGFVLNVMKKNYPEVDFDEVRVIGGGARSDLWNQIKCDVTGIKYTKLTRDDFTLLGNVLVAGHAAGIYKDLKDASLKFVTKDKNYSPDREKHEIYKKYVHCYSNVFDKIRDIYVDLKNIENG